MGTHTTLSTYWGRVTLTLTESIPVEAQYLTPEETGRLDPVPTILITSRYDATNTGPRSGDSDLVLQVRPVPRPYRWQAALVGSATGWKPWMPYFQLPGSIIMSGRRGAFSRHQTPAHQFSELCGGIEQCFGASGLRDLPDEGGNTGCAIRWACERATESGEAVRGARALAVAAATLLNEAGVLSSKSFTEARDASVNKPTDQGGASDTPSAANLPETAMIKMQPNEGSAKRVVLTRSNSSATLLEQ